MVKRCLLRGFTPGVAGLGVGSKVSKGAGPDGEGNESRASLQPLHARGTPIRETSRKNRSKFAVVVLAEDVGRQLPYFRVFLFRYLLVGAGRFERPTPCAQGRCATRLRYAPTFARVFILN